MKLEGIRVVDLSTFLAGPYLTMALADHGAEVIKIEPPHGDPARHIGAKEDGESAFFRVLNRGKRSVVLDLKQKPDLDALLALCDTADVVVESFRPGVADRLGVGYDIVRTRNPGVVYCSISGFGADGPYRDRPAHDLALEAVTGLLSMNVDRSGEPVIPAIPIANIAAALAGLSAVSMALLRRSRTRLGDYIDLSMHDALLGSLQTLMGSVFATGRQPIASNERTTGGSAFYQIYRTKDGRHIALAGQERKFVSSLLTALGRPDLIDVGDTEPGPHQAPLHAFLRHAFAQRSMYDWTIALAELDVGFSPVNQLTEALEDPNVIERGMVMLDDHGRRHLALPIRFAAEPAKPTLHAPSLGEHTDEILSR